MVRVGGKSWLKKGVSDLQGQATAWVSSWRQDTCVAWHKPLFNLTSRPPVGVLQNPGHWCLTTSGCITKCSPRGFTINCRPIIMDYIFHYVLMYKSENAIDLISN